MSAQLITALQDCVSVMERDLNGLAVIQPELKQAREALDAALAPPPAWTGEGLPPPGIMVECSWTSSEGSYGKAFTIGHDHDGRLVYQLIETPTGEKVGEIRAIDSNLMLSGPGGALIPKFRPLRTPEQIAAEEREKAIFHMQRLIEESDKHGAFDQLGVLYDAGLRFQGGAQ